ncbi:MAG TPA: imidazoleglycerol-phosphate dehydratase HisB [Bacillota bacterium]
MRRAEVSRKTRETQISIELNLDGAGEYQVETGIGFFDHMLSHLAHQSLIDLKVQAKGDLQVDAHHTVEDVGILFGQALQEALGEKVGITRYGSAILPMDDALVLAAVDLSGRTYLDFAVPVDGQLGGYFDCELAKEFFFALSRSGMNIHLRLLAGTNRHHILEAVFKVFGRALRAAVQLDPGRSGIPSTKGVLE